ncbi:SRPBCC domain-containing protein [Micromonospora sp. C28SCA-DRY-2]|uniref:SRPBCC domain-containing protein n=1 Tax=Micromonospora sp. C28SCA-DRY-2 TaxID=3059522 RepID=UPI002676E114|nr:SRPBCC domain-containing protein [Micromonospora sp. C28SCA-DRY-2]MDO3705971.1 SRPBCC domain-containing protein [Micromonospora sp. C28SCA-DRY-2]
MSTLQQTEVQTYRVYLKATPEQIWTALTQSDWTQRYGYGGRVDIDTRPGGAFRQYASEAMVGPGVSMVVVEGEVIEADPNTRLALTWRMIGDPGMAVETPSRLTYEIGQDERGLTTLTVTHDVTDAPQTAALVGGALPGTGGGWSFVLSDLKSLLETGTGVAG